jgi:hypothetical protein
MNLPKFLVQKLGKDHVSALITAGNPLPKCDIPKVNTHADYKIRSFPSGRSKTEAKKRWRAKQEGKLQPDTLYSLDDAIERAGL